jgi:hypothetical protein
MNATGRMAGTFCRARDWPKQRLIHAIQTREVNVRTWPPGHEAEIDWAAFETAHNFNLETSELSLVGLDLITVAIEILVPADAEAPSPPADEPTAADAAETSSPPAAVDAPVPTSVWAFDTVRDLRAEGKLPVAAMESKAALARFLADKSKGAAAVGKLRRPLKASYIEDWLERWGIWPLTASE